MTDASFVVLSNGNRSVSVRVSWSRVILRTYSIVRVRTACRSGRGLLARWRHHERRRVVLGGARHAGLQLRGKQQLRDHARARLHQVPGARAPPRLLGREPPRALQLHVAGSSQSSSSSSSSSLSRLTPHPTSYIPHLYTHFHSSISSRCPSDALSSPYSGDLVRSESQTIHLPPFITVVFFALPPQLHPICFHLALNHPI